MKIICQNCDKEFVESELDNEDVCPECQSTECERFYVYSIKSMTDEEKIRLIATVEFSVEIEDGMYRLIDDTRANLANIEAERFESLDEIIERIEHYFYDYHIIFN